eukprot:7227357-Pyramimonas_sp.AAC.1
MISLLRLTPPSSRLGRGDGPRAAACARGTRVQAAHVFSAASRVMLLMHLTPYLTTCTALTCGTQSARCGTCACLRRARFLLVWASAAENRTSILSV